MQRPTAYIVYLNNSMYVILKGLIDDDVPNEPIVDADVRFTVYNDQGQAVEGATDIAMPYSGNLSRYRGILNYTVLAGVSENAKYTIKIYASDYPGFEIILVCKTRRRRVNVA